jgi:hypothetical protein
MTEAYTPGLDVTAYRCFLVDPKLPEDHLVTAFRVGPTDARSVAQVTVYQLESEAAEDAARALDDADC